MTVAVLTSHPIQYYAPLFRELSKRVRLHVLFAHRASPYQQAAAGFGEKFEWDIDLLRGYSHEFLANVARYPSTQHFAGCDTPELSGKLRSHGYDALLVTGWHLKSYVQGILGAKRHRIPVIVRGDSQLNTPRHLIKRLLKRSVYPGLLRALDAGLYVGERNLAYWRSYGYPMERLFFSPHCVNNQFFAERSTPAARESLRGKLHIPNRSPVALFAGKLVPFKRPLDVITASARLRTQGLDLHVLVAGSGELEQTMREHGQQLRVPTHFLGFQNQTEIPAAYAACDLLVLPSTGRETWGLVANEAIACGRPVVVSDAVGCAPDLTADRQVGRTYPVGNTEALAEAMEKTIGGGPFGGALHRMSERHSLNAACNGIVDALTAVCASGTTAAILREN